MNVYHITMKIINNLEDSRIYINNETTQKENKDTKN